jgi:hypothetical protein
MRRPPALPLLLASAALLVPLAAGCGSGPKRAGATAGGASATGSAPGGSASGSVAPRASAGVPGGEGSTTTQSPPATVQKVPDGTVYHGWIIGTSGNSTVRVDLGVRYVNTATARAATRYLQTHGGGPVPGETPVTYVDVDLGSTRTFAISSTAVVLTTAKGSVPQRLNVSGFLAWLKTHLAKPLPVPMRLRYRGAPRYDGPLWMITVRGGVVVAIGQVLAR